jgi:ParB-like chromosome segregation protein Spo0J
VSESAALVELDGWKGYPGLVPLLVPIESVESHPENPRRGNLEKIATSLETYGQTKSIVVQDSTGYIVAGNHTRLAAMERLGWKQIAAVRADLPDDEALGYLMMDNAASDDGSYDDTARISILERLQEQGRIVQAGYSPDDLDDIIAAAKQTATTAIEEFQGGYSETDDEVAERQATRLAGEPMREVVLMLSEADYAQFATHVKICQREWGLAGTTATLVEAVRRGAEGA